MISINDSEPPVIEGAIPVFSHPVGFHQFRGKCLMFARFKPGEKTKIHIVDGSHVYDEIDAILAEGTANSPCVYVKPLPEKKDEGP